MGPRPWASRGLRARIRRKQQLKRGAQPFDGVDLDADAGQVGDGAGKAQAQPVAVLVGRLALVGVLLPKGRIYTLSHRLTGMLERAAVQWVELRRIGERVFAEPVDALVAARREAFKVGLVD
ncbi:hypothetical protein [Hymenobacter roseosalivarius]|nr:hypothetical protein [Hymenobacter roseosalivarius]